MEYLFIGAAGASWMGWRYWKHCERRKQAELDRAYWDRVRSECPSCGVRNRVQRDLISPSQ